MTNATDGFVSMSVLTKSLVPGRGANKDGLRAQVGHLLQQENGEFSVVPGEKAEGAGWVDAAGVHGASLLMRAFLREVGGRGE